MSDHWITDQVVYGLDLETTSLHLDKAWPVQIALTRHQGASWEPVGALPVVVNPRVEIPPETVAVHGITTARARGGWELERGLEEVVAGLERAQAQGAPVVGANVRYDLSVLESVLVRLGLPGLGVLVPDLVVGDGMVLDRWWDRGRPGRRNLGALCEHYGITLRRAHHALDDAVAAVELYRTVLAMSGRCERALGHLALGGWERARWQELARCASPVEVMALTGRWWLAYEHEAVRQGRRERVGSWPVEPYPVGKGGEGLEYARGWWRANAGRLEEVQGGSGLVLVDGVVLGMELARAFEAGRSAVTTPRISA